MHFAFIRFSSMGDVVLQTPLFAWIKFHFPDSKISLITGSEFRDLFLEHPFIDDVIAYKKKRGREDLVSLKQLSKELDADFIIDLHNTLRGKLLRFFSWRTPKVVVNKRAIKRFLLIRFKMNLMQDISSHHKRVIEDFAFIFDRHAGFDELESFIQKQTKLAQKTLITTGLSFKTDIVAKIGAPYIVISPVASFENKRWPIENFLELLTKILNSEKYLSYNFVILGGPGDDFCERFNIIDSERIHNLQGKTTFLESNEILAQTSLTITNDTGVAHLSESFGKPVLSFFGPTSPDFGFKPHLKNSKVLYANMSCSPCSATGSKACSQSSLLCMAALKVDAAFKAFEKIAGGL